MISGTRDTLPPELFRVGQNYIDNIAAEQVFIWKVLHSSPLVGTLAVGSLCLRKSVTLQQGKQCTELVHVYSLPRPSGATF